MHLLVQENRSLDEAEAAVDLDQTPADLIFLSFSDSDLGAAAAAWTEMGVDRPSLRLVNLARLRHPMSVDLYLDRVAGAARCIVLRLLGGLEYWRYGAEELSALCRDRGIALAVLAGDERDDAALAALGTVDARQRARLDGYFRQGGAGNLQQALAYAAHLAGLAADIAEPPVEIAAFGMADPMPEAAESRAVIVFYRAYLLAGDMAPITALAVALRARGMAVATLYVSSLKNPECAAFVAGRLRAWRPAIVLNATGFSARHAAAASPLEAADAPILQVVLAGSSRAAWSSASRGLSQTDMAMQVVLPELDGHLLTTAISFKAPLPGDPALQFDRLVHVPDPDGIALAAERATRWARLAATPRSLRRVAIVLSDYPGGGQRGHAVGLDSFASLSAILRLLRAEGYDTSDAVALSDAPATAVLPLDVYRRLFAALPHSLREAITSAWGDPAGDPAVRDGQFHLIHVRSGRMVLAVQPDRGSTLSRQAGYHDPDVPPCHAYVAFHLWLRQAIDVHAVVHLGAHGTLEWLPGKSVALSAGCAPCAMIGGVPVIYPFIVNNPGEAAAAKRRLGAVIVGHLTPPLRAASLHGDAATLEQLIEEFAAADGLDRRRTTALRRQILERAIETGLLAESGVGPDLAEDAALARLDAYLCDVKALQIRDGLHVFGERPPVAQRDAVLSALRTACRDRSADDLAARLDASPAAERRALLAALDGRFVQPGPAGAPTRGRADVLPTGRNLFAVDPRAIPTRSAVALAEAQVVELLRRHLQDHGDWPRRMVIDLWGSTAMRTGGEDLAVALLLMGVRPTWDEGSARVVGFQIDPLAVLDRPRVDVTLRISGLFRDAFDMQVALFDAAVRAVAARDEAAEWNPLAHSPPAARIYGPAPGCYGAGTEAALATGADEVGSLYLAASGFAYGAAADGVADRDGFATLVGAAQALLHTQDHAETDLLDGPSSAAQIGGFAAAAALLGGCPSVYLADTSQAGRAHVRDIAEEVARVVRGRAANPLWLAGMMRHGYQGAAEIARTLDALHGFATTLPQRFDRQFDLMFDATLGDAATDDFLAQANPAARDAMRARFADARRRGLWHPRRNDVRLPEPA